MIFSFQYRFLNIWNVRFHNSWKILSSDQEIFFTKYGKIWWKIIMHKIRYKTNNSKTKFQHWPCLTFEFCIRQQMCHCVRLPCWQIRSPVWRAKRTWPDRPEMVLMPTKRYCSHRPEIQSQNTPYKIRRLNMVTGKCVNKKFLDIFCSNFINKLPIIAIYW